MGRIASILSFIRTFSGTRGEVKVDPGGGATVTAEHYSAAGIDSQPLPGDSALLVEVSQQKEAATGYADTVSQKKAGPGEVRIYSRDSGGGLLAEIYLQADGSISLESPSEIVANGVRITTDGDVITSDGVSLRNHTHTAPSSGGPTSPPIKG